MLIPNRFQEGIAGIQSLLSQLSLGESGSGDAHTLYSHVLDMTRQGLKTSPSRAGKNLTTPLNTRPAAGTAPASPGSASAMGSTTAATSRTSAPVSAAEAAAAGAATPTRAPTSAWRAAAGETQKSLFLMALVKPKIYLGPCKREYQTLSCSISMIPLVSYIYLV